MDWKSEWKKLAVDGSVKVRDEIRDFVETLSERLSNEE
jgi:hypothetical protein